MTLALSFVAVVLLLAWAERREERRHQHARRVDLAEAWQHRNLVSNKIIAIQPNRKRTP